MIRKVLLASAAACLFSTAANANAACPAVTNASLKSALQQAIKDTGGTLGFGLNMWATVVAPDGRVCVVANSSGDAIQGQWLASRVISAQKAFTATTLSLGTTADSGSGTAFKTGKVALSTANLYTAVQPGGSLFGLQHSNPVAPANAYGDRIGPAGYNAGPYDTATYGTVVDPMIGQVIGGINVFGGGLALFTASGKVGGVGVSGDTSCTDHLIAWRTRRNLNLDFLASAGVAGVAAGFAGDGTHPDNIIFDPTKSGGLGSAAGWVHPTCVYNTIANSTTAATALPPVR